MSESVRYHWGCSALDCDLGFEDTRLQEGLRERLEAGLEKCPECGGEMAKIQVVTKEDS